jgi:hypothetical protein
MPLHLLPLLLTIVAVLVLGIVAVVCSTTGNGDRRLSGESGSGTNGLAGPADALGDAVERGDGGHRPQQGGLARHPVDDA